MKKIILILFCLLSGFAFGQSPNSISANSSMCTDTNKIMSTSCLGSAQTSGNIAITGWGSGAAVSAVSGFGARSTFTITAGTTPSLNPTIILTFPSAFPTAPICMPRQDGGGTGIVADLSIGTPSTTTCGTMIWLQTPVSGATYILTVDAR